MSAVEQKAKRRIRRFIRTGEPQARVREIGRRIYEYREVHHVRSIFFKRTIFLNRLKRIEKP